MNYTSNFQLTFKTYFKEGLETAPYILGKNPPQWYREMPGCPEEAKGISFLDMEADVPPSTYKRCPALTISMNKVIVLPAWSDYVLRIGSDRSFKWRSPSEDFRISSHSDKQHPGYRKDQMNIKFEAPWIVEASHDIDCMLMHPYIHDEHRFEAVNGIYSFKKHPGLQANTFFPIPKEGFEEFEFKRGDPLLYIVPLTERKTVVSAEVCSQEAFHSVFKRVMFSSSKQYFRSKDK